MAFPNGGVGTRIDDDDEDLDPPPRRPTTGPHSERGMDSSLQKHAPKTEGLEASSYKTFRRKLDTYEKMCLRRGNNCAVEAAYSLFAALQETHWEITETMDLEQIETNHFQAIKDVLDPLFKYGEDIEVPKRCK